MSSGPARLLRGVYTLFAIAAGARSAYQLATRFSDAPLAYLLSAVAATLYVVAAIALRTDRRRLLAVVASVELAGVVAVGLLTVADPGAFPDETVWSDFGRGYGFLPLVLPVAALAWLRPIPFPGGGGLQGHDARRERKAHDPEQAVRSGEAALDSVPPGHAGSRR